MVATFVGAGLFGAVFARQAMDKGYSVLVVDKRDHIGGNVYTEMVENIHVHRYGAHIFHTSDREIWDYVHQFADFNHYINSPIAIYKDELSLKEKELFERLESFKVKFDIIKLAYDVTVDNTKSAKTKDPEHEYRY